MHNPIAPVRLARYQMPMSMHGDPNTNSSLTSTDNLQRDSTVKAALATRVMIQSQFHNLQLLPIPIPIPSTVPLLPKCQSNTHHHDKQN